MPFAVDRLLFAEDMLPQYGGDRPDEIGVGDLDDGESVPVLKARVRIAVAAKGASEQDGAGDVIDREQDIVVVGLGRHRPRHIRD